ncbi:MAG TPA: mechanosensitive ion channel family protein [Patescibacteria group bacterium]|nr:mechanosensitive ion channel family protein [Patescibacteria group bacterium]
MLELPTLQDATLPYLRVALIAVVAVVAWAFLRVAVRLGTRGLLERRALEADAASMPPLELERRVNTIGRLVLRIGGAVIVVIAVLMALGQFSIDIGPAVAGLGVVGIAVGFGAQTLIRDWLAGIFVVLENQYSEGDVVRIGGVEGVVESFSLRRTTLRDLDGTVHSVPNGHITVASNLTRLWARVNLDISVAYDTDIDAATDLINRVGEEMQADEEWGPRLLEAPKVMRVNALADSAVTLKVLGQVRAAEQWAVAGELRKRILAAFSSGGVEIPFPHQVIVTRAGPGAADPRAAAGEPPAAPASEGQADSSSG